MSAAIPTLRLPADFEARIAVLKYLRANGLAWVGGNGDMDSPRGLDWYMESDGIIRPRVDRNWAGACCYQYITSRVLPMPSDIHALCNSPRHFVSACRAWRSS